MTSPPVRASGVGWALALGATLTLLSAYRLLPQFSTALPSDLGDAALNAWILWWNAHALPLTAAWWNAPMFAPAPNAFALSEALLALTPLTTPLIQAGVSPVAAYNVVFLLAAPLAATGAYLLAWELTHRRSAALIAGLAFGFNPYLIAQLPHLQMQWTCWLPLSLYALHRFVREGARRWLAVFGACWIMTALTNGYFLLYFPILLTLWVAWFARDARRWLHIAVAFVIASAPLVPLLLAYRARQRAFGLMRGIGEMQDFAADLTAIWSTSPRAWLSHLWTMTPRPEGELYPGLVLLLLSGAGAVALVRVARAHPLLGRRGISRTRKVLIGAAALSLALAALVIATGGWDLRVGSLKWTAHQTSRFFTASFWLLTFAGLLSPSLRAAWARRSTLTFYLLAAAAMFLMAMGPSAKAFGATVIYKAPYSWFMLLPGGDALRAPARFGELMLLCLCVAAALAWTRLVRPGRHALTAVATVMVLAEGWIVMPVVRTPAPLNVPALQAPHTAILELPMDMTYHAQTRALLDAIAHGRPTVNGFSGYEPPHFPPLRHGLMTRDAAVIDAVRAYTPLAVFVRSHEDPAGELRHWLKALAGASVLSETADGAWFEFPAIAAPAVMINDPLVPIVGVEADNHPQNVRAIFDRSVTTRWNSERPPSEGAQLRVTFDRQATISAIELQMGRWVVDFPGELEITVPGPNGEVQTIWKGRPAGLAVAGALRDSRVVPILIQLEAPVLTRGMTVRGIATNQDRTWSVAGLRVFGR